MINFKKISIDLLTKYYYLIINKFLLFFLNLKYLYKNSNKIKIIGKKKLNNLKFKI